MIEPPSGMCCRKLNLDHVQSIMDQISKNSGIDLMVAEIILLYKGKAQTFPKGKLQQFRQGIPHMQFCVMVGHHSTMVVKNLMKQQVQIGNLKLKAILERLKIRKCRVLARIPQICPSNVVFMS